MGPLEERTRFKSVLEKLLSLLAAPEHPLTLFLDDVHRTDMGSLEMLEELFKNEDIHDLMIVICYRDNEVSSDHPLILSLNKNHTAGRPGHAAESERAGSGEHRTNAGRHIQNGSGHDFRAGRDHL